MPIKVFQTPPDKHSLTALLLHPLSTILPPFGLCFPSMCPRATAAQHGGAAMARAAASVAGAFGGGGGGGVHSFVEEEYIDLDLGSCGEFEFRACRSAAAPCGADELLCRGRSHRAVPRSVAKQQEGEGGGGGGRRSTATVAPLQQPHAGAGIRHAQPPHAAECSRRRKAARTVHAKLLASRAFFRSLFARTSCSDEQCHGGVGVGVHTRSRATLGETKNGGVKAAAPSLQIKNGYGSCSGRAAPATLRSSIEQEKLMDEEEHAASSRQRKSFSGVIRWRPAPAPAPAKPPPPPFPTRRGSSGVPALKRSSSARSESEGLIQGAIAYCKRSQQQLGLARKSVSDAALCSWPSLA